MSQYTIADAKANLSELMDKALSGEDIVSARNRRPLLRLVPIAPVKATRKPGSAKGKIIAIAPDFDAALPDFPDCR